VDETHLSGGQFGDHNFQTNVFGSYVVLPMPISWPVRVGHASLLSDVYESRPVLRRAIDAAWTPSGPSARTLVLTGDGGTGKTQLAAAIFREVVGETDLAVWVTASSRVAVVDALAEAGRRTDPSGSSGDSERDAASFLAWLETTSRAWIIVLDDVAEPADVLGLWPSGECGSLIVTTRRRDAVLVTRAQAVFDVGVFTPEEARHFLTQKLGLSADPGVLDEADELAMDLGFLPLALAQASAVIADEAITCAQYRENLHDRARTLAEVFGENLEGGRGTLAGTWALAVHRADTLTPAGLASRVLHLAAVLSPHGIPESVLTAPPALQHLSGRGTGTAATVRRALREDARRAVRNLHRLSLITHDPQEQATSVRMHALAQRAALESLSPDEIAGVVRAAADSLTDVWPDVDNDAGLGAVLRANAVALTARDRDALWTPRPHPLLFRAGGSLGHAGQIVAARDYFAKLAADCATRLGPAHPDTLSARHEHASWQGQAGDPAGAFAELERLLQDRTEVLGPDHPDTLSTRGSLARWTGRGGNRAGAASQLGQLVDDLVRALGPDHRLVLSTRQDLAHWQGKAGDTAAATRTSGQLVRDMRRVLGPDHRRSLAARREHARWVRKSGDPERAVSVLEDLLTDQVRVLGPHHRDVLRTRGSISRLRGRLGDAAQAVTDLSALLHDQTHLLGPRHPDTLATRFDLAQWNARTGQPQTAATIGAQLLADLESIVEPDHPAIQALRTELREWNTAPELANTGPVELSTDPPDWHGLGDDLLCSRESDPLNLVDSPERFDDSGCLAADRGAGCA
jgi:hypothetical protein